MHADSRQTQVYYSPVPLTRTFPVTLNSSGDVVYPDWAYPYRGGWIIPSWASGLASIGGPIAVYILAQIRIRSAWDASAAIMGSVWAVILGSLFQVSSVFPRRVGLGLSRPRMATNRI